MGKTSTKLAVYALVPLLLLHLSGLAAAVDYYFYRNVFNCTGDAVTFFDVPKLTCCEVVAAAAVGTESNMNQLNAYYGGGGCSVEKIYGSGTFCVYGGGYTGAGWAPKVGQSLLAGDAEKACHAQTKPNGIAYSEESTKGHWILATDNATEMYTQMGTIPHAQKVDWLQAHGATFKPDL